MATRLKRRDVVIVGDEEFKVVDQVGSEVIVVPKGGGKVRVFEEERVKPKKPLDPPILAPRPKHSKTKWLMAEKKAEAIEPILGHRQYGSGSAKQVADQVGVHSSTVHRWLQRSQEGSRVSGLLRQHRSDIGHGRITGERLQILAEKIDTHHLTKNPLSIKWIHELVNIEIEKARQAAENKEERDSLRPISLSSVHNYIQGIPERTRVEKQKGKEAAKAKFDLVKGREPRRRAPLAKVEIDHYQLPLDFSDPFGEEIGPVSLTLGIDAGTRVVLGWYLSLNPPSTISVALCLAQMMFPKDDWLKDNKLEGYPWPCYGMPKRILVDNAKEFHSNAINKGVDSLSKEEKTRLGLKEFSITLDYRKPYQPKTGGQHVERLFETLGVHLQQVQSIWSEAATSRRAGSSKEEQLSMDLTLFEQCLNLLIVGVYHNSLHRTLGRSPLQAWNEWYAKHPADRPRVPSFSREGFIREFLPVYERTVQRTGIELDYIHYQSDALAEFVNVRMISDPSKKLKLEVRRDPRNINYIIVLNPKTKEYFTVPNVDGYEEPTPLWVWKLSCQRVREEFTNSAGPELRQRALQEVIKILQSDPEKWLRYERSMAEAPKSPLPATPSEGISGNPPAIDQEHEAKRRSEVGYTLKKPIGSK